MEERYRTKIEEATETNMLKFYGTKIGVYLKRRLQEICILLMISFDLGLEKVGVQVSSIFS